MRPNEQNEKEGGCVTDDVRAAIAERMNRLPEVGWDRCIFADGHGTAFGWIDRDDARKDFVALNFQWGETNDLDGEDVKWFSVGTLTSSAEFSRSISERISGDKADSHLDCERVEHVLGGLVDRKIVL